MNWKRFLNFLTAFSILLLAPLTADIKLHKVFSDHMVLQRDVPVGIYGTGDEGEEVTVDLIEKKTVQSVKAKVKDGRWKAVLKPTKFGGPYVVLIKGKNTLKIEDVLFGDVWICSGQSNMQTDIAYYKRNTNFTMFAQIPGAWTNRKLRLFKVKDRAADVPEWDVTRHATFSNGWAIAGGGFIEAFSATGFFFGRTLVQEGEVPIGLIHTTIGGTSVSSWVDDVTMTSDTNFQPYLNDYSNALANYDRNYSNYLKNMDAWKSNRAAGKNPGRQPDAPMGTNHVKRLYGLYRAMIAPLQEFRIAGAIWYQGESDSGRPMIYRKLFPAMIQQWRTQWNQGPFPFLFVQLANYMGMNTNIEDPNWPYLREAQTMTLSLPNTGMALAIDGGMEKDIHPPLKELVGRRLAAMAQVMTQGKKKVSCGPMVASVKFEKGAAVLSYSNVGGGLIASNVTLEKYTLPAGVPKGFAIAGADKKYKWATAEIKGSTVVVKSAEVPNPVSVRYAWANFPLANLYNKDGFPAVPWRSDDYAIGEILKVGGIAMGKPFVASHPNGLTAQRGIWGALTDGFAENDDRRCWSTDNSTNFPKTVTVDLQGKFKVDLIRVHNSKNGGSKNVEVSISKNGADFSAVGTTQFDNGADKEFDVKGPHSGVTHVRLTFADCHDENPVTKGWKNFIFVRELEVQGAIEK
jgi:sialate O-acetylesterase